jgi:hypothetical protein
MHVLSQRIPFRICMHEKKIDLMSQILQQNNLGDRIPEGAKKKKPEDLNSKKGNSSHALIAINSSPDAWIVDSGASHHMAASKEVYSSLDACKGPPILMGDNSSVEVTDKGRIELTNGSFENVLHVPKLSVNLLSCVSDDEFWHRKEIHIHTKFCGHLRHANQLQGCYR